MIEINRRKSTKIFRINPWNPRCIDVRENRHGARWQHWQHFDSTMAAIEALLAAQRDAKEPSK